MDYTSLYAAAEARGLDAIDASLLVAEAQFRLEFYRATASQMEYLLMDGRGKDIAAIVAALPNDGAQTTMRLELDI